ncbi:MAG: thiolase family protein [Dehalococcoidia bacterium]|nr:thiolase family protein [Dehalococcoidia bacterium]
MREVVILGVGMHKFGRFDGMDFTEMGSVAIQNAMKDADIVWKDIEAAFCGNTYGDTASGHRIVAQIGLTGIPIVNVENACSSSGSALRLAYQEIAAGIYDTVLAFGWEQQPRGFITSTAFPAYQRAMGMSILPAQYAMLARRHMVEYGTTVKHLAKISVKNHKNGYYNPYAHYQVLLTEEQVLNSRMVCDPLTLYMCCPTSHGAAAAVLCSKTKARRYTTKPITVAAAVLASGKYQSPACDHINYYMGSAVELSGKLAYEAAGLGPEDINIVETHEAMANAEIEQCEELGICEKGEYTQLLDAGETEITGRIPVNPSGGLLARGHPLGATSLAQVAEVVWQLREQAGPRQVNNPKVGLCHTTGSGPNSCVTILKK